MQAASAVFMVRPVQFGFNPETAASNHFQHNPTALSAPEAQARALAEFDAAVEQLRRHGIRVLVFEDTLQPATPDSIFPNNWVSLHADGRAVLYPMCAPNRRAERRPDILAALQEQFHLIHTLDFTAHEQEGRFLEGTGSLVFDHQHRRVYAALSVRTQPDVVQEVAEQLGYEALTFRALDAQGQEIYHTNVMMWVGAGVAVVCLASIANPQERRAVVASLQQTGHELVEITQEQMAQFAGNMLLLQSVAGQPVLAMSQSALAALGPAQRQVLERHAQLLPLAIPTIETLGGGSVRCLLAEIFLPPRPEFA